MIPTARFQILKCCRGNCMRLLWSYTRYGALHPISEHYTRSERVQCSLIGCTASSATSCGADTRQGQLDPHRQDRHYAPHHLPEASHNASHRSVVSIRPQSSLCLTGVMLPNWCRASPAWLGWHLAGAAMEQTLPRAGLFLSGVTPLMRVVHLFGAGVMLPN